MSAYGPGDKCPKCGALLDYDEVDIGVGVMTGNYGCHECGWCEPHYDDIDASITTTGAASLSADLRECPRCGSTAGTLFVKKFKWGPSDWARCEVCEYETSVRNWNAPRHYDAPLAAARSMLREVRNCFAPEDAERLALALGEDPLTISAFSPDRMETKE